MQIDEMKARAKELGWELTEEQLKDKAIRGIIIGSKNKTKVDLTSGSAAQFPETTPSGVYEGEEFECDGRNVAIQYTAPDGEFTPFVLIQGTLTVDSEEYVGSAAMSPIQYSKVMPQAGQSLSIKVRDNKRASVLTK